jgi:hypothetical protein
MSRDVRDPVVVYNSKSGYTDNGFTVVPVNLCRLLPGHYVLVPVLNEQAGDAMIADLKRRADSTRSEVMGNDTGYHYPNHSALFRAIDAHYRARGVTSEEKLSELRHRWVRTKGYREPGVRL